MKKDSLYSFLSIAWVIIISLQFLRIEFSYIYFPIFILFIFLNCFFIIKYGYIFSITSHLSFFLWIFYLLSIYIALVTFFFGNLNDFLRAFPRMMLMPITVIFLYNFIFSDRQFYKLLNIYILFGVIAGVSIIYQVFYGPLGFLVDTQIRDGLTRYASTLGSLTAYGGAIGIILIVNIFLNQNKFLLNFIFISILALAGIISLSKAGLMNVFIFCLYLLLFSKLEKKYYLFVCAIIASFSCYLFVPDIQIYIETAYQGLRIGSDIYQVQSLETQAIDRLTRAIPKLAEHSIWNNFFGFGLIGGQGAFGLPYSISGTTHNQFTEFFNIGGIFLFVNIISIFVCLMLKLYQLRKTELLANMFYVCNLFAMLNMFFFNGFFYQPATSFVLWLSIVYVLHKEKIK